jgi:TPR repeat protein
MYLFDPSIIDRSKAVKYYEKACTVGGFVACHRLGGIYYSKDMNMRDYSKAKEYFEKACNEDYSEACLFLGEMYKNGFGVEKNEAKAKELYETAQKHSDVKVQIHRPPPASAPPSSDSRVRISEGGSLPSARKVKITPEMDMDFKEKALASSMKYNEVACNDGYSAYCHQLGAQYMSTQEYSKAKEYFEKACNMELPKACATLGEMYGNGFGVEKNQDKARKFDEKAQKINK